MSRRSRRAGLDPDARTARTVAAVVMCVAHVVLLGAVMVTIGPLGDLARYDDLGFVRTWIYAFAALAVALFVCQVAAATLIARSRPVGPRLLVGVAACAIALALADLVVMSLCAKASGDSGLDHDLRHSLGWPHRWHDLASILWASVAIVLARHEPVRRACE